MYVGCTLPNRPGFYGRNNQRPCKFVGLHTKSPWRGYQRRVNANGRTARLVIRQLLIQDHIVNNKPKRSVLMGMTAQNNIHLPLIYRPTHNHHTPVTKSRHFRQKPTAWTFSKHTKWYKLRLSHPRHANLLIVTWGQETRCLFATMEFKQFIQFNIQRDEQVIVISLGICARAISYQKQFNIGIWTEIWNAVSTCSHCWKHCRTATSVT